jgi:tripartite ATP-independent transporter DctM subunit
MTGMGPEVIFYSLALLLLLVLLGVHVGIALGLASVVGVYLSYDDVNIALSILGSTAYESIRSNSLAVIPLFMLMGEVLSKSGAARDLYLLCNRAMSFIPGRLAAATVLGNAAFAAVSGVAIASAATFSRIAYPEMIKLGYNRSYALGVIAGSGSLGMLIPPSVLLIVWAILTEGSVGALFLGGVIPGLLLGTVFIAYCAIAAYRNPTIAPKGDVTFQESNTFESLKSGLGILALVALVLGGIWLGVFTPTEAAGFGALGSLLVGLLKGMKKDDFLEAIYNAGKSTAPIMFLLIAGSMYSRLLAVSGGVGLIQDLFISLGYGPVGIIFVMTVIWLLLGTIVDSISDILLTVPIFYPIAMAAGMNDVAFAIYGVLIIEAGLLTPPLGLLIFAVKSAVPDPEVTLKDIFVGSIPYWIMMIGVALLVISFPSLASWLPSNALG